MKGFLMPRLWNVLLAFILFAGAAAAQQAPTLQTDKDKLSYALGMDLGKQFRAQSVEVDPDIFLQGLKAALAGGQTALTEQEARAMITRLQNEMMRKQAEKLAQLGEKNKKEGEAFLAANKGKEGVVTLESGLQYRVTKAGEGPKPTIDDTVVCNYKGTLIDGKEFDSSYKRNEPATFPVSGVIKGWTEALQLMPVGSKWQLFVPANLAYGERGAGDVIAPNSTLIFEVELLSIKPKEAPAPAATPGAAAKPSDTEKPADAAKPADASKPAAEPPKPQH